MKKIPLYKFNDLIRDLGDEGMEGASFYIFDVKDTPKRLKEKNPFRNDFYAVFLNLKGSLELIIDFDRYTIGSNEVFFGTPGQVFTTVSESPEQGIGILFKGDFFMTENLSRWLRNLPMFHRFHSTPTMRVNQEVIETLIPSFSEMIAEYSGEEKPYKHYAIRAQLITILIKLARLYSASNIDSEKGQNSILQFESLIDQHFKETRSVKEYAEMLFMTPQNLNRIVKRFTGKSASELIQQKLLLEIKRHLLYTDKTSDEIAYQLGFLDDSYFIKYFKKAEGMTPKSFRDKFREKVQ